jgi:hypothetical protein
MKTRQGEGEKGRDMDWERGGGIRGEIERKGDKGKEADRKKVIEKDRKGEGRRERGTQRGEEVNEGEGGKENKERNGEGGKA